MKLRLHLAVVLMLQQHIAHAFLIPSSMHGSPSRVTPSLLHRTSWGTPSVLWATPSSNIDTIRILFTEELCTLIADDVIERVDLPLIPDSILALIIEQAFQKLADSVSPQTLAKIELMLAAAATDSPYDDMDVGDRNKLADVVAKELSENVDVPLLASQQEEAVLQQIFRAVFATLTTNQSYAKSILVHELDVALNIFKDPSSRKMLVDAINKLVDIPFLNEEQEAVLFDKALDQCADALERMLPANFVPLLRGMPVNGLDDMKAYLVDTVSAGIDLPILNDEQERAMIEGLVTALVDSYVLDEDGTTVNDEVGFMLLSEDDQREHLLQRSQKLEHDMLRCKRDFEEEYGDLKTELQKVQGRLGRRRRGKALGTTTSPTKWRRARTNLGRFLMNRGRRNKENKDDDK